MIVRWIHVLIQKHTIHSLYIFFYISHLMNKYCHIILWPKYYYNKF